MGKKSSLLAQACAILEAPSPMEMFDAARGTAFAPQQRRDEIVPFCEALVGRECGMALEIGTGRGLTTLMLAASMRKYGLVVTVGLPTGPNRLTPERARALESASGGLPFSFVQAVRADSHDEETLAKVRFLRFDVLFLDGDHTYEGARRDHETYAPLVKPGGIVALHDARPTRKRGVGVPRLVDELREEHAVKDVFSRRAKSGYGISWYEKG